jgi:hypothetical protein
MTAPSEPPSADGVAAGIADADMVSASAKAQPANPIIRSRFILVPPPLWQVLLRIISSVFAMPAERCIHRLFRTVATDSRNSAASSIALISALTVSAMMPVPRWICRRSLPTSAPGQTEKNSVREYVFRSPHELGHWTRSSDEPHIRVDSRIYF